MRFLLHPTTQRTTTQGIRNNKGRAAKRAPKERILVQQPHALVSKTVGSAASTNTTYVKSWGQQCSPNCGCVVRFEATLNPETNQFTSASYHAKSVMVSQTTTTTSNNHHPKNGGATQTTTTTKLEPARTLRTNRLMFQPCSCDSLHALASKVTDYLPQKNALAIGSSMEFAGVRSSPAFRHTVLEKQGLSTSHTHCFDVVEEALTAMIKGHMPKARPQVTLREAYAASMASSSPFDYDERGERGNHVDPEDDEFRMDMAAFLRPPRAMSALRMLDMKAPYYSPFGKETSDYDDTSRTSTAKKEAPVTTKQLDWVTYVDELNERFHGMQRSA